MAQYFDETLDFGAFPGKSDTYVDVTSDRTSGCPLNADVRVSLCPFPSADHTSDEQMLESIKLSGAVTAVGTIRIRGRNDNTLIAQSGPQKGKGTRIVGHVNVRCEWQA